MGIGDPLGMAATHALASGMGGMRTAGDLVARMQITRGMRLPEAKAHVAAICSDRAPLHPPVMPSTPKRAPPQRAVFAPDRRDLACTCQAYSVGNSLSSTK